MRYVWFGTGVFVYLGFSLHWSVIGNQRLVFVSKCLVWLYGRGERKSRFFLKVL